MNDYSRRKFIRNSALGLSSLWLPQFINIKNLYAQNHPSEHFFLLINIKNGLDATLGLDPWIMPEGADEHDMFIEYSQSQILQKEKIRLAPAAQSLLPFADRLAVINGVLMSDTDNGHDVMNNYITSGNGQGRAPTISVEFGAVGEKRPYGVITNAAPNLGNCKITLSSTSVLAKSEQSLELANILAKVPAKRISAVDLARESVVDSRDTTRVFYKTLKSLQTTFPTNSSVPSSAFATGDALTAAAAFLNLGASYSYFEVRTSGNLDTHSDHPVTHMNSQKDIWEQISQMMALYQKIPYGKNGESLLDRTTIMAVTEFSRTPFLNAARGKDHNPLTNSVLIAGRGINPGVYGQSQLIQRKNSKTGVAIHMAHPLDFSNGRPAVLTQSGDTPAGVGFIYPENVARTISDIMNINANDFENIPGDTKPIPGILKS